MVDGFVTQSRALSKPPGGIDPFEVRRGAFYDSGTVSNLLEQTTTSFRTNLSEEPVPRTGQEQLNFLMGDKGAAVTKMDRGHEFQTETKVRIPTRDQEFWFPSGSGFKGPVVVNGDFPYTLQLPDEPEFDLSYYGNRLITSAIPTLPKANLMQSVAELAREGFASVVGSQILSSLATKSSFFRSLGSEYLNVQFGWVPFLNDLSSIIRSVSNANQSILNLEKNDGLVVRRRRGLKPTETVTSAYSAFDGGLYVGSYKFSAWSDFNPDQFVPVTKIQRTKQRVWFSGAFTYKLAVEDSLLSRFERYEQYANALLGTRITPSVLWELTPWSWLVDWVVDIQSALQRAELMQSDGNVMKYGYLMRETTQETQLTSTIRFSNGAVRHYGTTSRRIVKRRYRATPFGFGLNPSAFTDRQWAILAALGLSKSGRALW